MANFADEVIMSRRGRMGRILSPRHTLPPNTTCIYYFHGQPTDRVWIYFTHFHLQTLQPATSDSSGSGSSNAINNTHLNYFASQVRILSLG